MAQFCGAEERGLAAKVNVLVVAVIFELAQDLGMVASCCP
eukprot:CAMPEP_0202095132 /NCGR_PEP_ID=MMETSP0964-20121228/49390_1 /ASSEMBLY_ACC=CAM_ASM_000500 /TAXON_ID=4773 /ORGANISM="Schizochytrium aggregatum, Strain ATCC28209" /LENGTH=39 /DNA_ID= /DNA_START= /DNA_END= /DNA_ORIENTATION=